MEMDHSHGTATKPKTETQVKKPSMYRVYLLNDDYTPMDFVIEALTKFFKKTSLEAAEIMMEVHEKGSGLAGVFSRDIAETKAHQVVQYARKFKYPLQCEVEKE